MTGKPVVPRELASRDVEEAIDHYGDEAGEGLALRFIDALSEAYRAIGSRPGTGSPRYAHELDLPGLRSRKMRRFPYLVFYLERDDHIDVWRVLLAPRDIPAWMAE
ncbi:type II toxin-antitoxin system RelE/ParE family toxin [Novosphingobium sp. PS1R-30]|uniref:Type II toxin-antitoxin system RelE/ParE family toxin n=1 Tax=Novosphingobium anseongense TaxID=3133436 RepID=A0ABU8S2F3_9SPHN